MATQSERRRGGQQRIPRPADFRIAGPPAWAALAEADRSFSLADIRPRLAASPPGAEPVSLVTGSVPSAVLVPLVEIAGETHVLFIKRPETMPTHKGEIAFPGGKSDPAVDADLLATALREAREEIGLDPAAVEVVARLSGVATAASRFTISPYVGFLADPPDLVPNPGEVVRVLEVPLAELLDAACFHEERWDGFQRDMAVFFFELADETVWGATARILTDLLTRLVATARDHRTVMGTPDQREVSMDIEGFYAEDERRRHSAELEFGRDWQDVSGRCEVSWVEDTGELYLMREPTAAVTGSGAGDLELMPMSEVGLVVEVLGVIEGRDAIAAVMSGWDAAMPRPDGVVWLRDRVAHADEHAKDAPSAPSDSLPND